jgi:hypothetical protein
MSVLHEDKTGLECNIQMRGTHRDMAQEHETDQVSCKI